MLHEKPLKDFFNIHITRFSDYCLTYLFVSINVKIQPDPNIAINVITIPVLVVKS